MTEPGASTGCRAASATATLCLILLAGCATIATGDRGLPPAPTAKLVDVFFGTDRNLADAGLTMPRATTSSGAVAMGVVHVAVPLKHQVGEIEQPGLIAQLFGANPDDYMSVRGGEIETADEFFEKIRLAQAAGRSSSALVFVHGYNVSFADAALRTAQLAVDLHIRTVPVFYDWPSKGETAGYLADEDAVERSLPDLAQFLETFAGRSGSKDIFVIAHSMGARITTRALADLLERRPDLRARYRELIPAAPDIDAVVFKRDIAPRFAALQAPMTLYASSNDRALKASHAVHQDDRAGESGDRLVVVPGVETIDASAISTDFLGHSYFASDRRLLADIAQLIRERLRAPRRPLLQDRRIGDATYWAFPR